LFSVSSLKYGYKGAEQSRIGSSRGSSKIYTQGEVLVKEGHGAGGRREGGRGGGRGGGRSRVGMLKSFSGRAYLSLFIYCTWNSKIGKRIYD
jgi:hypothetical protein